jgi:GNAT superfamily N-acetyltransferase
MVEGPSRERAFRCDALVHRPRRNRDCPGTICTGDTYGGGWVQVLFTRRLWRKKGVATALLREAFRRFWDRGEHSIGLVVDTANPTGAFRLYESAGMAPTLGLVIYEKQLSNYVERSTGDSDEWG